MSVTVMIPLIHIRVESRHHICQVPHLSGNEICPDTCAVAPVVMICVTVVVCSDTMTANYIFMSAVHCIHREAGALLACYFRIVVFSCPHIFNVASVDCEHSSVVSTVVPLACMRRPPETVFLEPRIFTALKSRTLHLEKAYKLQAQRRELHPASCA